ncbi:hypothetical protein LWI28_013867 [Acer negundo]|uniref:Late embryogenesis abundant protein LEA-2 subgroup domain-containing protein n=1 Tax=Acer negundo TaxID=4023 RepID=A0AAD5P1Y2_ACENE|nr:hypothetical protein LWI28_013867 [Acer negundo]
MSHTQSSQPVSDSRRFSVLRRLILVLILLFAVITIINWTVWLILNPKPPVFTVNSLSLSNSKQILNLQLSINNPNKKITLFMDDLRVLVFYKDAVVSKGTSMNLKQPVCLEKMSVQSLSLLGDMVGSSERSRRSMTRTTSKADDLLLRVTLDTLICSSASPTRFFWISVTPTQGSAKR